MIKAIKNCFVEERVNLGRQKELDIAKGIAIIFMVLCHGFSAISAIFFHNIFSFSCISIVMHNISCRQEGILLWQSAFYEGLPVSGLLRTLKGFFQLGL